MKRVAARRACRHISPPKRTNKRRDPRAKAEPGEKRPMVLSGKVEPREAARQERRLLIQAKNRSNAKDLIAHYTLQAFKGKQKAAGARPAA